MASSLKVAAALAVAVCVVLVLNMGQPVAATECKDCLADCADVCVNYSDTACSGICTAKPPACQSCKYTSFLTCGGTCYGPCAHFC